MKKGKVELYFFASNKGRNVFVDKVTVSVLADILKMVENKFGKNGYENLFATINEDIGDKNKGVHWKEMVKEIYSKHLTIDYDIAKNSGCLDIIYPKCFKATSLEGSELIELLDDCGLRFVVSSKYWFISNIIGLDLECTGHDNLNYLLCKLGNGPYSDKEDL